MPKQLKKKVWARSYVNFSRDAFVEYVKQHDWSDVLTCNAPNEAWAKFSYAFCKYT